MLHDNEHHRCRNTGECRMAKERKYVMKGVPGISDYA